MISFGQELRRRRTKMGLNLREASKGCGISPAMLSRFERGIGLMEMSAEKTAALADFFRWNVRDMMILMENQAKKKGKAKCGK